MYINNYINAQQRIPELASTLVLQVKQVVHQAVKEALGDPAPGVKTTDRAVVPVS